MTSPWAFSWFSIQLGPKWFLRGVEYVRGREWPECLAGAALKPGDRVLDIGSAPFSLFPLYLASKRQYILHFTDVRQEIAQHRATLTGAGLGELLLNGQVVVEIQDARQLKYADGTFDVVFAISTIEHIPDHGDVDAMREIARVLRPGGLAVVSVPCGPEFRNELLDEGLTIGIGPDITLSQLFQRRRKGRKVFFQRRYDTSSIHDRLVGPSGMRLVRFSTLRSRFVDIRAIWKARPPLVKALTNWLTPILSATTIEIRVGDFVDNRTEAAVLTLRKL